MTTTANRIWNAQRLKVVHPDLVKVFNKAMATLPFDVTVVQTERSAAEQRANLKKGVSQTTHSRHVLKNNICGKICAIDAAPRLRDGSIPWKRLDMFQAMNTAMMAAAKSLSLTVEWGGNWKTIKDMDHWQLPWAKYP
jgi:peptidoglycan LD-endopeptidase CwlK